MNILIVGLGSIGKKHVQALKALKVDATLYALRSSPGSEPFEDVCDIQSLDELPVRPDFAIISNPTDLHFATLQKLLQLQCPLFIEKPVVRTLDEAQRLLPLLRGGPMAYVACHLRHHPCLQFVREHLQHAHAQVDEVNAYCGSYMPEWVPGIDWRKSFRFDAARSGGVHMELIHEMDYISWLFGHPASVTRTLRSVSSLHMPAVDYAHYALVYDTFVATITLNYFRRDPKRTLEILFEDETWIVDLLAFSVHAGGKQVFSSPLTVADLYCNQMRYFLDCIRTGRTPMNSAAEACDVLSLALHE